MSQESMVLQLTVKQHYGVVRFYPNCEKSEVLAMLLGSKTFTNYQLTQFERLGFKILIEQPNFR